MKGEKKRNHLSLKEKKLWPMAAPPAHQRQPPAPQSPPQEKISWPAVASLIAAGSSKPHARSSGRGSFPHAAKSKFPGNLSIMLEAKPKLHQGLLPSDATSPE